MHLELGRQSGTRDIAPDDFGNRTDRRCRRGRLPPDALNAPTRHRGPATATLCRKGLHVPAPRFTAATQRIGIEGDAVTIRRWLRHAAPSPARRYRAVELEAALAAVRQDRATATDCTQVGILASIKAGCLRARSSECLVAPLGRGHPRHVRHQARNAGEVPVLEVSAGRPDVTEVVQLGDHVRDVAPT